MCVHCGQCQWSIHLHQAASNTQSLVYLGLSSPRHTHIHTTLTRQMVVPSLPKQCTNPHTHAHTNKGGCNVCFSCISLSKRGWHQPCSLSIYHTAPSLWGSPFMPTCYSYIRVKVLEWKEQKNQPQTKQGE